MKKLFQLPALFSSLLSLVSLLCLSSCREENDEITPYTALEIATVTSVSPLNLEVYGPHGEAVSLSPSQKAPSWLRKGLRVRLYYSAAVADTARRPVPVNIKALGAIPFDTVRALSPDEIHAVGNAQAQIYGVWRTGPFVNMRLGAAYHGDPRTLILLADKATVDSGHIRCYLVSPDEQIPSPVVRETYASYFLPFPGEVTVTALNSPGNE